MRKQFLFTCIASFSLVSGILSAYNRLEPGCFSLEGDLLYVKTYSALRPYTSLDNSKSGETRSNNPDFRLGYSLEGIYAFCERESDLRARFTYAHSSHNDSNSDAPDLVTPGTGSPIAQGTGTAHSNLRTTYYSIDAVIGEPLFCTCNFDLTFLFGANYTHFKRTEDLNSSGIVQGFQSESFVNDTGIISYLLFGTGPELGFDFHYVPFCCLSSLSFEGNLRGSILVARERFSQSGSRTTDIEFTQASHPDNPQWHVIPFIDTRVSVNYDFCCSCFHSELKLGYLFINAFQADYYATSFEGPFAGATISF